jgi:hypothetical protein
VEYPKFDPKDPFLNLFKAINEIMTDPDYKPHLIELVKAKTRFVEAQTLEKLNRIRTPRASTSPQS